MILFYNRRQQLPEDLKTRRHVLAWSTEMLCIEGIWNIWLDGEGVFVADSSMRWRGLPAGLSFETLNPRVASQSLFDDASPI